MTAPIVVLLVLFVVASALILYSALRASSQADRDDTDW